MQNFILQIWKSILIVTRNVPWENYRIEMHPNQSELFRFIPISVSKSMRIIPNQSEKCFVSRLMKNDRKSIRLNPINSETSIRINPNQSASIQGWNESDWFWLHIRFGSIRDRIDLDWSGLKTCFQIGSDSFRLMSRN